MDCGSELEFKVKGYMMNKDFFVLRVMTLSALLVYPGVNLIRNGKNDSHHFYRST